MSVYKRNGSRFYYYDFYMDRARYSGSTRQTTKKAAKREEDRKKLIVKEVALKHGASDYTSFSAVAQDWLDHIGQYHTNAKSTLTQVVRLIEHVGADTPVSKIDSRRVAAIVAARRKDQHFHSKSNKTHHRLANATVNRSSTQLLRKILRWADRILKVPVQQINWNEHMLKEPKERVREASGEEERLLINNLSDGYDAPVRFAIITGCRLAEIVGLTWNQVQFPERQLTIVGKNENSRTIPVSDALYSLLQLERGHHKRNVFTYVARRTEPTKGRFAGERYPVTYYGLQIAFRRAVKTAGIENLRFHDLRHTAATRILRASNLRVAQRLLGHADITTTAKYAHAQMDDLRRALETVSSVSLGEGAGMD